MDRERQYRRTIQNFRARGSGREPSTQLGICRVALGWGPGDSTKGLSITGLNPWSCQISPTSRIPPRCNIKRLEWKLTDHATCHPWEHTRKQALLGREEVVVWRIAAHRNHRPPPASLPTSAAQTRQGSWSPSQPFNKAEAHPTESLRRNRRVQRGEAACQDYSQVDKRVWEMQRRAHPLLKQDRERHGVRNYPPDPAINLLSVFKLYRP